MLPGHVLAKWCGPARCRKLRGVPSILAAVRIGAGYTDHFVVPVLGLCRHRWQRGSRNPTSIASELILPQRCFRAFLAHLFWQWRLVERINQCIFRVLV